MMLLFWLPRRRVSRRLHGLPHRDLPLALGWGMLCLRLRMLWGSARLRTLLLGMGVLRLRLDRTLLRMLLFLMRARRWGRCLHLLLELLATDSLTRLVAIVTGANRPLLRRGMGIART